MSSRISETSIRVLDRLDLCHLRENRVQVGLLGKTAALVSMVSGDLKGAEDSSQRIIDREPRPMRIVIIENVTPCTEENDA